MPPEPRIHSPDLLRLTKAAYEGRLLMPPTEAAYSGRLFRPPTQVAYEGCIVRPPTTAVYDGHEAGIGSEASGAAPDSVH